MSNTSHKYPPELRERAIRLVAEVRPDYASEWEAIGAVASKLGIGSAETLPQVSVLLDAGPTLNFLAVGQQGVFIMTTARTGALSTGGNSTVVDTEGSQMRTARLPSR